MPLSPALLPHIITTISQRLAEQADAITALDQAIGDGDHVINLQRGLEALQAQSESIGQMAWPDAWQAIAMTLMPSIGGASGSLYATLFLRLAKDSKTSDGSTAAFAQQFSAAIEAVKQRGKSDIGEKTLLDVLVPVSQALNTAVEAKASLPDTLQQLVTAAHTGLESTRDMLATKGRASFLGERSRGHLDAGAKTACLMIEAIADCIDSARTP